MELGTLIDRTQFTNESLPQCRICLEADDELPTSNSNASSSPSSSPSSSMISPCGCRGSMRHVHVECLDTWRRLTTNPLAYYRCEHCLTFYRHSPQVPVEEVGAGLLELWADHRAWELRERRRDVALLGLALLVLGTVGLATAHALLVLVPSVSPVWVVFVSLDLCALLFVIIRYSLSLWWSWSSSSSSFSE